MLGSAVRDLVEALAHGAEADFGVRWAGEAASVLGWDGLAVSLALDGPEPVWFSDDISARLEDAQFTVGQGPSLEATHSGAMCLLGDVESAPGPRWEGFLPAVTELPVAAVFAFPLRLGGLKMGALTGYRRQAGMMTAEAVENALVLCDAVTEFFLRAYLSPLGPDAADETESGGPGVVHLHRAEVHQATGMVSAQLSIPLPSALSRLRAEAFVTGREILDISRAVLNGELRLAAHPDSPAEGEDSQDSDPGGGT